ncbi:tetratricopeptide repeat-containing sensor histidine kinase [Chitinophagaceae bacterium MMS25-I14]
MHIKKPPFNYNFCNLFTTLKITFLTVILSGIAGSKVVAFTITDTAQLRNQIDQVWTARESPPDSLLAHLLALDTQCRQAKYNAGISRLSMYEARVCDQAGKFEQCRQYAHNGIPFCDSTRQGQITLNRLYNQIANTYVEQGKYPQSTIYYYKALQHALSHGYYSSLIGTYNDIGLLMNEINDPQSALYYLQKSAAFAQLANSPTDVANALVNEAIAYGKLKQQTRCIDCYRKALAIATQLKNGSILVSSLTGIGITYTELKQPDSGLVYGLQALRATQKGDIYNTIFATYATGTAYAMLHKNAEAEVQLKHFLELSKDINLGRYTAEAQKALGALYYAEGNKNAAATYFSDYIQNIDTLNNSETDQQITHMQIKYHTAEQTAALAKSRLQVQLQKNEIQKKNLLIIIVCICIAAITATVFFRYRYMKRKKQSLQTQEAYNREISELRAMISGEEKERRRIARELHDEVGSALTIAGIRYETLKKEIPALSADKNYQQIGQLLKKIRSGIHATSHSLLPDTILQNSLPEAIRLMTEPVKFSAGTDIIVQCFGDFAAIDHNTELKLNVYRIIQELLNNVIKHAAATELLIELIYVNGLLKITVEDNGQGYNETARTNGLGLENINARVRQLAGNITTESVPGEGTTVYIEINAAQNVTKIPA